MLQRKRERERERERKRERKEQTLADLPIFIFSIANL